MSAAISALPCPCLMIITEPHPNLVEIVMGAVTGGVNAVQWRDNSTDTVETVDLLWKLAERIQGKSLLIINIGGLDDPFLMRNIAAQGVHLPERRIDEISNIERTYGLVGTSIHSVASAKHAAEQGADYLIAGTIFASQSHPEIAPAGLDFLKTVCAEVDIPVLAIGGITPARVKDCISAGAAGVAVLSPLMRAEDPKAVAQMYRSALETAWEEVHGTDYQR